MTRYLPAVKAAVSALRPYVIRTPLIRSRVFTELLGFPVYLKLENLQVTGAFKIRGAMNKLLALKQSGVDQVVAASSGSHAMGVALAARTCGVAATIFMSESSPEPKRHKVRGYGANLIISGLTFDDAYRNATAFACDRGIEFVSGIEDKTVMAGHGTMGLEILEDLPSADLVAIPVGGGGAISGLLMALKEMRPDLPVWGVQSDGASSMKVSLERGEVTQLPEISTVADAIAVRQPGRPAFQLVRERADGVTTVGDDPILRAMGRLALWEKLVAEPAAVAPLAVDWPRVIGSRPKAAVFVVTGGNVRKELLVQAVTDTEEAAPLDQMGMTAEG